MRSTTALVAALATVVTSVAAVEPAGRPRIYFPRHVKRQFTNTTSSAADDSASVTAVGVPLAQESDLGDLLGSLLGGKGSSSTSASRTRPTKGAGDGKVTTIIIASTIVVTPKPSSTDPPATGSGEDVDTFPASALPSGNSTGTSDEAEPTVPPLIVLPTFRSKTRTPQPTVSANSTASTDSSESASSVPTSSSSSSGILLAPTGVVSSSSTTDDGLLGGIGGLLSTIVSDVTDPKTTANTTNTADPTSTSPSATKDNPITIPLTILPGTGSSTTPSGTAPPDTSYPPPVTNATETIPTVTAPPTGPTSVPDVNSTITDAPPDTVPVTSLPTTIVTISPNSTSVNNTIPVSTPEPSDSGSVVTSNTPTTTFVVTQPWLPTTIVVDPTPTTTTTPGLAPTSAVTLPTALPKAITPDTGNDPPPDDTTLIQIGFGFGMNYPFVVSNAKAAAQIFQLLPQALSYAGGFPVEKVQMRKLIPLNTQQSLGYVTTLAIITYPSNMVEALRMDVKIPSSPLYNSPEQLVYNLTQQINSAIDIILGSYPEDGAAPGTGDGESSVTSTSVPNADPFDNGDDSSDSTSSSQKGATAGIALGVVGVAAAYGAAMFVIARRYKRKKQAHRRASSISDSSGMRTVGSPALMGGALLSRDFSSYGGVAGGRDSQGSGTGSGRSGGNSARTAVISAPMAAENSLGWN